MTQNGTQYVLDLNPSTSLRAGSGLTQVLSDGINSYTYGLGRISQTDTNAQYFHGDGLNSTRIMTDESGTVVMANSYEPYGELFTTSGMAGSHFGYAGEYTDSSGLQYLRARYFNPLDGRFISRDTWEGSYDNPLSLNRWNYVKSNPINYTDPSGYFDVGPWCSDNISSRADAAEKYVNRTHAGHLISDELNTYTAGGIGVQCRGTNVNQSLIGNSGEGIAQVTDNQIKKEYGKKVLDWLKNFRGCGLTYRGEQIHDQNNLAWAVHYMRRVIQQVVKACDKCTSTDKFIAAALAQNGPGFSHFELTQTVLNKKPDNPGDLYRYLTAEGKVDTNRPDGVTVNWVKYFDRRNDYGDTYKQLNLFQQVVWELYRRNWYIPNDLNWATIRDVATQ